MSPTDDTVVGHGPVLQTSIDRLTFDPASGRLIALRHGTSRRSLVDSRAKDPLFVIQYLNGAAEFRTCDDRSAADKRVTIMVDRPTGAWSVTTEVEAPGRLDIAVRTVVRGMPSEPASRWQLEIDNRADVRITDVRFPIVASPLGFGASHRTDAILWPRVTGALIDRPELHDLEPDCPFAFQLRPENFDMLHYPGFTFAQFLAYFDRRAGIYLACDDTDGRVKVIKPVGLPDRVGLGIAHIGDWTGAGRHSLGYDVLLRSFRGTWEDAAEIYREWALRQPWAGRTLMDRPDVPDWLLDSPAPVMVRIQGIVDEGPAEPRPEFLPYARILPLLEHVAERAEAPVLPILMAWERGGPWVYPEALPPIGGADSFAAFTAEAHALGWPTGTFCNGTRWVTGHFWAGYDGRDVIALAGGVEGMTRTHTGDRWAENWDAAWRPSHPGCVATGPTRSVAINYVRELALLGLDMIQFFDQNLGACSFPCFAADHGHPDTPGSWMTHSMTSLIGDLRDAIGDVAGGRLVALSVEGPVSEPHLQRIQLCDVRIVPDGHVAPHPLWYGSVPLFHYLYHELILIQGGFGFGPEPHHLTTKNAFNLVVGAMPGGVLQGDGRLLERDSVNFGPWQPYHGDEAAGYAVLRAGLALRRGPGRPFLVFGRMERSASVRGIKPVSWIFEGRRHRLPSIFHRTWRAPDGRLALAVANWTAQTRQVTVDDVRFDDDGAVSWSDGVIHETRADGRAIELPPFACAMLMAPDPAVFGLGR